MTQSTWPEEIYLLIGGTAVGKTEVGIQWARQGGAEIVSADSMLVYRGMDIGTAKPDRGQRSAVPHHLIDVVEPCDSFSLGRYLPLADAAIREIHGRGKRVLVVGGTGLYLKAIATGIFDGPPADEDIRERLKASAYQIGASALHERLEQIDPVSAQRIHRNDLKRVIRALEVYEVTGCPISSLQTQFDAPQRPFKVRWCGLRRNSDQLNRRINRRVSQMIEDGLIEETRALLAHRRGMSGQARKALGYQQIIGHLEGRCSLGDAIEEIKIATRRFAKSQRTWFKSFTEVSWIDADSAHAHSPDWQN